MNQTTLKVLKVMIELQKRLPPFGPTLDEIAQGVDSLGSRSAVHPHIRELVKMGAVEEVGGPDSARKYVAAGEALAAVQKALDDKESQIARREELIGA